MAGQSQINQPFVDGVLVSGFTLVENQVQKILVIAQKTSGGTATDGALLTNVQNNNATVNGLFGARSMAAGLIRNVRKVNPTNQIDVIPLDDAGGGTAATGTITIVGTATEAGTYTVIIGSKRDHSVTVSVASGDAVTAVALAIVAAVTADLEVPVTAGASVGVATFTAANDGTVGNTIGIVIEGTVAGLTHAVVAMASGATDPSFTTVFDPVASIRYQNIPWAYSTDLATIKNFINPRFNNSGRILDGRAVVSITDTFSNLETAGLAENTQNLQIIGDLLITETSYKGPGQLEIPYAKAAQMAGIRAIRLTDEANIADLVIANLASLDRFGGKAIASLPYFNTPLNFLPIIDPGRGFIESEIEDLFADGISVWGNNLNNTNALMGEMVTTYKTDVAGKPDDTFKFMNYDDTGREGREFYFNNYKDRFKQHRLTQGDVMPGRAMANLDTIRRFSNLLYNDLAEDALVVLGVLPNGQNAQEFYNKNLIITLTSDTTATVIMILPIVTQLRVILYTIEVNISTFSEA